MSLYQESVPQLLKMLSNLDAWLEEATAYAETREFDVDVLVGSRLSPDQIALVSQVQSACDTAKFVGSRLTGGDAPRHEDTETTVAELRRRIVDTRAYLADLDEAAFDGAGERDLFLPFLHGGSVTGTDYLREFALPNFYFHITTAYAILRHNGVKLGKRAYIGSMNVRPAPVS